MLDLEKFDLSDFETRAKDASALLKALSNERRLMILCELGDMEKTVGEIQTKLELSQSALSQHLAVLREQKIVETRRVGQSIFYSICDPAAARVIGILAEIFCATEE